MIARLLRRRVVWAAAVVLALLVSAGVYWFQPWKLVTNREVNETLAAVSEPPSVPAPPPQSGPAVSRKGDFVSQEHQTSGTARVIRNPDGSQTLELVNLATSDGPDLRVWLTDQPVRTGVQGWRVFDDGRWVELGHLKGNRGNQTYAIPAGTDVAALQSVTIWCKRFSVSFGAATLTPIR